jgi:hypothetical protein
VLETKLIGRPSLTDLLNNASKILARFNFVIKAGFKDIASTASHLCKILNTYSEALIMPPQVLIACNEPQSHFQA